MTPENFAYWLQGFMEISNEKTLDEKQVQIIKDHLALVFTKVTPDRKLVDDLLKTKTKDYDPYKPMSLRDVPDLKLPGVITCSAMPEDKALMVTDTATMLLKDIGKGTVDGPSKHTTVLRQPPTFC